MNAIQLVNRLLEAEENVDWSADPEAEPIPRVETKIERWAFSPHELETPEVCRGDDRMMAHRDDTYFGNLEVLRNGTVLNHNFYYNTPVSDEIVQHAKERLAKNELELIDGYGTNYDQWKYVIVDKDGNFKNFADDASLLESEENIDWSPDPEAPPIADINIEHWAFTENELKKKAYSRCRSDDRLFAGLFVDRNPRCDLYIGDAVVLRNGTVTGYDRRGHQLSADMKKVVEHEMAKRAGIDPPPLNLSPAGWLSEYDTFFYLQVSKDTDEEWSTNESCNVWRSVLVGRDGSFIDFAA